MEIIPTHRKERLPKGFSYSLGAEAISQALQGIPQDMVLNFRWREYYWASEYNARLRASGNIKIVEARYSNYLGRWQWHIDIYAVPSEHNQYAREELLSTGLSGLKLALTEADSMPEPRRFRWLANYNLSTKSLSLMRA